jgi:hypothetical protein
VGKEAKLALLAGNVIIYIENPQILNQKLELINEVKKAVGYKIKQDNKFVVSIFILYLFKKSLVELNS